MSKIDAIISKAKGQKTRKRSLHARISDSDYQILETLSKEHQVSVASLVESILNDWIEMARRTLEKKAN